MTHARTFKRRNVHKHIFAAIVARGGAAGVTRISAGNYGGKLGPFHFHLHKLIGEGAA